MSTRPRLQALIEAAQELSPLEQLDLISVLAQALHRKTLQTLPAEDFWVPKTLEQHLQAQQVQPVADIAGLRADFWPEDEACDDLIEYIYKQRREDQREN
jgi:hypothetical protein